MATNNFATKLHRNTNKIIVILVYAILEWILISLLLLNSFFFYLIVKFANYFGLKSPCIWCSRVDHVLEPGKNTHSCRDLVCDSHAREISNLVYCSMHGNLIELQDMCEDCMSSQHNYSRQVIGMSARKDLVTNGESMSRCSCCNGILSRQIYSPGLLLNYSCPSVDCSDKENLVMEASGRTSSGAEDKELCSPTSQKVIVHEIEGLTEEHRKHGLEDTIPVITEMDNEVTDIVDQSLEETAAHILNEEGDSLEINKSLCPDYSGQEYVLRVVPIELIDSFSMGDQRSCCLKDADVEIDGSNYNGYSEEELSAVNKNLEKMVKHREAQCLEDSVVETNNSSVSCLKKGEENPVCKTCYQVFSDQETPLPPIEDVGSSEAGVSKQVTAGINQEEEEDASDKQDMSIDQCENGMNNLVSEQSGPCEVDEEKFPETPTSFDSLHYLQKKSLLLEKRQSVTPESIDGSVASEMDGADAVLTNEQMKAVLKAEQKALRALYAELEEERSASAIAANQTMAMITRLQEEKAQMQMETLQYQRMMEEQSEYDQEALQLLNALLIKKEKEKQELENELEVYRQKVSEYEAKENLRMIESRKSSASCSRSEEGDDLSIDINAEVRGEHSTDFHNETSDEILHLEEMAIDCVKHMTTLDDSLAEYEEERSSILDQLKVLEEKLIALGASEVCFEDIASPDYDDSNWNINNCNAPEEDRMPNNLTNGSSGEDSFERKTLSSMAKNLLPLLDAAEQETEQLKSEECITSESAEIQNALGTESALNSKTPAIEQVDRVYEKLQALEGDTEMDLLQDILQHLQDLKSVELRVRDMSSA